MSHSVNIIVTIDNTRVKPALTISSPLAKTKDSPPVKNKTVYKVTWAPVMTSFQVLHMACASWCQIIQYQGISSGHFGLRLGKENITSFEVLVNVDGDCLFVPVDNQVDLVPDVLAELIDHAD